MCDVLAAYQYNESIEVQFGCGCSADGCQQIDVHRWFGAIGRDNRAKVNVASPIRYDTQPPVRGLGVPFGSRGEIVSVYAERQLLCISGSISGSPLLKAVDATGVDAYGHA